MMNDDDDVDDDKEELLFYNSKDNTIVKTVYLYLCGLTINTYKVLYS